VQRPPHLQDFMEFIDAFYQTRPPAI
jgi:hypothetical protein